MFRRNWRNAHCKAKTQPTKYPKQKLQEISASLKRTVFKDKDHRCSDDESEILSQVKDEFRSTNQRSTKDSDSAPKELDSSADPY